jgi:hypothetical protein
MGAEVRCPPRTRGDVVLVVPTTMLSSWRYTYSQSTSLPTLRAAGPELALYRLAGLAGDSHDFGCAERLGLPQRVLNGRRLEHALLEIPNPKALGAAHGSRRGRHPVRRRCAPRRSWPRRLGSSGGYRSPAPGRGLDRLTTGRLRSASPSAERDSLPLHDAVQRRFSDTKLRTDRGSRRVGVGVQPSDFPALFLAQFRTAGTACFDAIRGCGPSATA